MKRIITAAALLVSTFFTMVQANDGGESAKIVKVGSVNRMAKDAFKKKFPQAKFETWTLLSDVNLYFVRFVNNEEGLIAYVDVDGDVVATVRTVNTETIPLTVTDVLSSAFKGYTVKESLEMVLHGELNYLVTMENAKSKLVVKFLSNGEFSQVKKQKIKA